MIFLLMLLLSSSAEAKPASARTVVVQVDRFPNEPKRRQSTRYYLSKNGSAISCRTDSVPQHEIRVKGLKSLEAPFFAAKVDAGCERAVSWGGKRACLEAGQNRTLQDMLRWCSNI